MKNNKIGKKSGPPPKKGPTSQGVMLKSGIRVLKARGGMDASRSDFKSPGSGVSGASKGPAGGASAGGNYGGNRNPSQNYGGDGRNNTASKTKLPKRRIGGPGTTKDVPYKSNVGLNVLAGQLVPGGGFLAEGLQRKAYKDRQKYARKEGLYREYYIGNQFKTDPADRVLKPNSPSGRAFIKEAKPDVKPKLEGGDEKNVIRCPDGTFPPCVNTTKTTPVGGGNKGNPFQFNFQYRDGGMVRGSGKVLKGKIKKARLY